MLLVMVSKIKYYKIYCECYEDVGFRVCTSLIELLAAVKEIVLALSAAGKGMSCSDECVVDFSVSVVVSVPDGVTNWIDLELPF